MHIMSLVVDRLSFTSVLGMAFLRATILSPRKPATIAPAIPPSSKQLVYALAEKGGEISTMRQRRQQQQTRPETRHKMRLVCVLFTLENNARRTDGPTDGRTQPLVEMRRRIQKENTEGLLRRSLFPLPKVP